MAKKLADIQRQIHKLQQQAEEIKSREVAGVVTRIKEAIEYYELSVEDVFGSSGRGMSAGGKAVRGLKDTKRSPSVRRGPTGKVAVKYRDQSGNTWTGRGLKPRWLAAALNEGKKLEDFAV